MGVRFDKEDVAYIVHNGILLGPKVGEILPFATTWMELEGIVLSEISQMEREKYHTISFIY